MFRLSGLSINRRLSGWGCLGSGNSAVPAELCIRVNLLTAVFAVGHVLNHRYYCFVFVYKFD